MISSGRIFLWAVILSEMSLEYFAKIDMCAQWVRGSGHSFGIDSYGYVPSDDLEEDI